ncbi:MAG TPA: glycosyltransferase family 2 protein [Candidatus Binataceae bacterium]|nr:glycosyltransferase family 2 protein [Candidatus Binataceae bacterium]
MSTATPQVSVIIPTYNRHAMLREAIASVLAQPDVDFELIIVDDGSTDGTSRLLGELTKRDPRLIATHTEHRGPAAARNRGVELARASWIAFLDSDDLWVPTKLARQLDFMRRNPAYQIAQCQEIWIRGGRRVNPGARHVKQAGDIFIRSLRTCLISPSAVIISAKLFRRFDGFDDSMNAAEDYDLWLRILIDHEIGLLDEPLVTRRAGHHDQLSLMSAIDRFRILALMKLLACERLPIEKRIAAGDVLVEKCRIYGNGLRHRGRIGLAEFYDRIASQASQTWGSQPDDNLRSALREIRVVVSQNDADRVAHVDQ